MKTFVFDHDGMLNNYRDSIFVAMKSTFEQDYNVPFKFPTVEALLQVEISGEKALNAMIVRHGLDVNAWDFIKKYHQYYQRLTRLNSWVGDLLDQCESEKRQTYICSNNSESMIRDQLGEHQVKITQFFCFHTLNVGFFKPDPRAYKYIQETAGLILSESVYVTDEIVDAKGALDAGFGGAYLVSWGLCSSENLVEARKNKDICVIETPRLLFHNLGLYHRGI